MGQAESSTGKFKKHDQQQQQEQLIPGLPDVIAMDCLVRVPHQFHSTMTLVCQSWRRLLMHPSFYQERSRSGMAEHMVFLIQPVPCLSPPKTEFSVSNNREDEVDAKISSPLLTQYGLSIYNATNQTWRRMMMRQPGGGYIGIPMFCQCVALPASGKLLLLGGWDPNTLEPVPDVYVLDLIGCSRWRRAAPMSVARSFFACGIVGQSTVYVAGGHDNLKNALRSAEVYDADADKWRTLPPMAEERDECQGLSWEGDSRFWVVSGYSTDSQGRFRSDAECYDPVTGSWSRIDGVWPYSSLSPRGLTANVTITNENNTSGHQYQWWWFLGSQQQPQDNVGVKDQTDNCNNLIWKVVNSVQLPSEINGTTSVLCVINALGLTQDQCFMNSRNQQRQRIFFMSSGGAGGRGTSSSSLTCGECKREGEGAYILTTKWNHICTSHAFSGFPHSASCLVI
ncbi:hypothetical protein F2P56_027791 [Juglans regia]|uniref:F-box/kelch-repeat protein SKIP20-like n=2 Tax=Juglans regia TaxID=51240 RepID=A0A2I4G600_JUGRE|nr:F-box/kelch-repeat protein SKIP20-like [Juglans regia]KAF5452828.1 hypothetical protein F2P56_027791 [Juglans regia]